MNRRSTLSVSVRAVFAHVFVAVIFIGLTNTVKASEAKIVSENHRNLSIPLRLTAGTFDPLQTTPETSFSSDFIAATHSDNQYHLVQFQQPLEPREKDELAQQGVELLEYVPHFAWIVRMDSTVATVVEQHPLTRWVGVFQPAWRVEPVLMEEFSLRGTASRLLIVSTFAGVDGGVISAELAKQSTILESASYQGEHRFLIEAPLATLPQLAAINGIRWIEPAPDFILTNATATETTNLRAVQNDPIEGFTGAGQLIAIADTGLDRGTDDPNNLHDDFEDGNGNSRINALYDRAYDGNEDHSGHGTHVAGTAVGNGLRSGSDPANHDYSGSHAGAAPEADLLFQAIGSDSGYLNGLPFYLTWLFEEARDNPNGGGIPAKIHSNSWGIANSNGAYSTYSRDIDQFVWDNQEMLILFAAGNNGLSGTAQTVIAPSTAKNALTVGATNNIVGEQFDIAGRSGRGPTRDGRIKPDIVAPGIVIESTASQQNQTANDYLRFSGTSMATPMVAGSAALVRESLARTGFDTPSAALVKAILLNGAFDLVHEPSSNVTMARPTHDAGWGQLDMAKTLIDGDTQLKYWDTLAAGAQFAQPLATGESNTHSFMILGNGAPLTIHLVWNDFPGSTSANGGLVNDLDLHLVAPDGTVFYANNADPGALAGPYDHVNNVLGIDIAEPQLGEWQIVVRGFNVAQETQPYALVARADFDGVTAAPDVQQMTVNGAGVYVFDRVGLTLELLDSSAESITVELIRESHPYPSLPSNMLSRYYRVTLHAADRAPTALSNITLTYGQSEFDGSGLTSEYQLQVHRIQNNLWQSFQPHELDTNIDQITVNSLSMTAQSEWTFGPIEPTAVQLSSNHAGEQPIAGLIAGLLVTLVLTTRIVILRQR